VQSRRPHAAVLEDLPVNAPRRASVQRAALALAALLLSCVGGGAEHAAPRASLTLAPPAGRTAGERPRPMASDGPLPDVLVTARPRTAGPRTLDTAVPAPPVTGPAAKAGRCRVGGQSGAERGLACAFDVD
jgi:hypothetical protein